MISAFKPTADISQVLLDALHEYCCEYNAVEEIFWFRDDDFSKLPSEILQFIKPTRTFKLVTGKVQRSTIESGAFDLFNDGPELRLQAMEIRTVATGVKSVMSHDLRAIIKERSGLAANGLRVGGGFIDADYHDEWRVIVQNLTYGAVVILHADRIAQFKIEVIPVVVLIGSGFVLKEQVRQGGFGSTGK